VTHRKAGALQLVEDRPSNGRSVEVRARSWTTGNSHLLIGILACRCTTCHGRFRPCGACDWGRPIAPAEGEARCRSCKPGPMLIMAHIAHQADPPPPVTDTECSRLYREPLDPGYDQGAIAVAPEAVAVLNGAKTSLDQDATVVSLGVRGSAHKADAQVSRIARQLQPWLLAWQAFPGPSRC